MSASHFSTSYAEARRRFRDAAAEVGATFRAYRIAAECPEELAIDLATLGPDGAPTVVTSSGVHGVEGFLGSAIQLALLDRLSQQAGAESDVRHVLIHGINPFGFSRLRRFNEDNVDLNRNFLANAGDYKGAPEGYAELNGFLNPESPPSGFEPFQLKALWNIWRTGVQALKQSVAGGHALERLVGDENKFVRVWSCGLLVRIADEPWHGGPKRSRGCMLRNGTRRRRCARGSASFARHTPGPDKVRAAADRADAAL